MVTTIKRSRGQKRPNGWTAKGWKRALNRYEEHYGAWYASKGMTHEKNVILFGW